MLGLRLREEFREARPRGTTVEFTNAAKTGALDRSAQDFLRITYPSSDLIKAFEAATLSSNRAVVLVGDRGQGKSHLLAALYHLLSDPAAGAGLAAGVGRHARAAGARESRLGACPARHRGALARTSLCASVGLAVRAPSQRRGRAQPVGRTTDRGSRQGSADRDAHADTPAPCCSMNFKPGSTD